MTCSRSRSSVGATPAWRRWRSWSRWCGRCCPAIRCCGRATSDGCWSRPRTRCFPGFDPRLAEYTAKVLAARGVEVRVSTRLRERRGPDGAPVRPSGGAVPVRRHRLDHRPAALAAHPPARAPLDERGRILVDDHLRVQGLEASTRWEIRAAVPEPGRRPVPPDGPARLPAGHRVRAQRGRRPRGRHAGAVQVPDTGAWPSPSGGGRAPPRYASSCSRAGRRGRWAAPTTC